MGRKTKMTAEKVVLMICHLPPKSIKWLVVKEHTDVGWLCCLGLANTTFCPKHVLLKNASPNIEIITAYGSYPLNSINKCVALRL